MAATLADREPNGPGGVMSPSGCPVSLRGATTTIPFDSFVTLDSYHSFIRSFAHRVRSFVSFVYLCASTL